LSQRRNIVFQLKSIPHWGRFLGLAAAGALLAHGRYDWAANHELALRSWTLSLYFFCLILGGIYSAGHVFSLLGTRRLWAFMAVVTVGLNLPYCWLGLDRHYFLASHPLGYAHVTTFVPEWLGQGHRHVPWNSTDTLLMALLALSLLGWLVLRLQTWASRPAPPTASRQTLAFFLLVLACLAVETWMHLSYRSPYTYIIYYGRPASEHFMSAYPMLPDGRAVVNPDFPYFIRLEELFQGNRIDTPTMLIRRAFPFYLSSQFSYFLGPFHGFLAMNILCWLLAAMAIHGFCRNLTGSLNCARIAAILVACGPGFIMYAAQPMSYLPGYAALALSTYLYHRIITASPVPGFSAICSAGIVVGLAMLTSDTVTWGLFYIGYALLAAKPLLRALGIMVVGVAVYWGFLCLIFNVFGLQPDHTNDKEIASDLHNLTALVLHFDSSKFFPMVSSAIGNYCMQVMQANFVVPGALAMLGLFLGKPGKLLKTVLLLLMASFAGFAFLYFGEFPNLWLASEPRFSYSSYPAIVMLAAFAIDTLARHWSVRGQIWPARLSVALPLLACLALGNIDAFGFMPHLYFHFYYTAGGYFN